MTIPMRLSADEITRVRAAHPIVQVLARAGIYPPMTPGRDADFMISCPLPAARCPHTKTRLRAA